jgi:deoxycytidine triphosphate deaminase
MPILGRKEIERRVNAGELLHNARRQAGKLVVEPASYDLCVGIVLWKDGESGKINQLDFDGTKDQLNQPFVTLQPGQMILVLSREDIVMPLNVSGTVYSRNKLQKENTLALNAGHVDPGFRGPIIIRLINLGAIPWTLTLGEAVFTIVFHSVQPSDEIGHAARTREETLEAARKTASEAFPNPFHDLYKEQIDHQLGRHYSQVEANLRNKFSEEFFRRNQVIQFAFAILAGMLVIVVGLPKVPWKDIWDYLKTNQLNVVLIFVVIVVIEMLIVRGCFWLRKYVKKKKRLKKKDSK